MKKLSIFLTLMMVSTAALSRTYVLKKGTHGSNKIALITKKVAEFRARFDDSAIYQTQNSSNQGDINKLFGFSDCFSHHHTNSARFGWRWYKDALEIHAYTYAKKKRQSQLIQKIDLNTSYDLKLAISGDKYLFYVDGVEKVRMDRGCTKNFVINYRLFPYFGGDETAPQDIRIELD